MRLRVPIMAGTIGVATVATLGILSLAHDDTAPKPAPSVPVTPSVTVMPSAVPVTLPSGMCPSEDSCFARYAHGEWQIIRGERPAKPRQPWQPVSAELARDLRESSDAPDRRTRDWSACSQYLGETTVIACPDGWVETS